MVKSAAALARSADELQSLPEVYRRISEVIDRPNSSSEQVARVASEDPGLTSRMLRLVNSALFGFPGKIETLSHAISLLGTDQVRDIALSTSVIDMFEGISSDQVDMRSFWLHSLGTAIAARSIATRRREDNVERHFVCGLLHDIGSVIIYTQWANRARRLLKHTARKGELLHSMEAASYGFHHGDVGRELLKVWGLPVALQEAVGYHHRPSLARMFPVEAATTHVADIVTGAMYTDGNGESFVPPLQTNAWNLLGLDPDVVPHLVKEVSAQLTIVSNALLGSIDE